MKLKSNLILRFADAAEVVQSVEQLATVVEIVRDHSSWKHSSVPTESGFPFVHLQKSRADR